MAVLGYILASGVLVGALAIIVLSLDVPYDPPDDGGGTQPPYDLGPTMGSTLRNVGTYDYVPTDTRSLHSESHREEVSA